jgi:hypothetical protein
MSLGMMALPKTVVEPKNLFPPALKTIAISLRTRGYGSICRLLEYQVLQLFPHPGFYHFLKSFSRAHLGLSIFVKDEVLLDQQRDVVVRQTSRCRY